MSLRVRVEDALIDALAVVLSEKFASGVTRRLFVTGIAVASVASWSDHRHAGLAILHGFLGWSYLLYRWLVS